MPEQTLIPFSDQKRWNAALKSIPHGPSHTWDYFRALAYSHPQDLFLYHHENNGQNVCCPVAIRKIDGKKEVFSPYGFSGFVMDSADKNFLSEWQKFMTKEGFVTAYIMQHPAFKVSLPKSSEIFKTRPLFMMALNKPFEMLLSELQKTHRYEIRRMQNDGETNVTIEKTTAVKKAFLKFYPEAMERAGASETYRFSSETLGALIESPNCLMVGAGPQGKIEAVSLFLYTPYCADYFLSASSEQGRKYSRLLVWKAIEELRARKIPVLNLGGGVKTGDDLEQFKRRFGGREQDGIAIKQIFDKEAYNSLCKKYGVDASVEGYFPPYWKAR